MSHGHAMVRPIVAQAGFYRPSGMLERMWSGEQQGTLAQLAESWRVMPQLLGQAVALGCTRLSTTLSSSAPA